MNGTSAGTARPIVYYGDPVLHRSLQPVETFDAELKALAEDMFASMEAAEGVGLAANQIGVDLRLFVMDCPDDDGRRIRTAVANPVIQAPAERRLDVGDEGCLSVPGQYYPTPRQHFATVTGFDLDGKPLEVSATGFAARCLQHETDHLNGILYVDRLPRKQRKRLLHDAGLSER